MRNTKIPWLAAVSALVLGAGCIEPVSPPQDVDTDGTAAIRLVAAATDAPALDVWVDGTRTVGNVEPGDVVPAATSYLTVPAGVRTIAFTPYGGKLDDAYFARPFTLQKDARYTIYTYGSLAPGLTEPFGADFTYDDRACAEGVSCAKVLNTANDLGALDVWLYLSPEEGWVRTDKFLSPGEAAWRPLDLDEGQVCGVGFAPAGARAPTMGFAYKAPAGENQLFLMNAAQSWFMNHNYPAPDDGVVRSDLQTTEWERGNLITRRPTTMQRGLDRVLEDTVAARLPLPELNDERPVPFWDDPRFEESPWPALAGLRVLTDRLPPRWQYDETAVLTWNPPQLPAVAPRYHLLVVGPAGVELARPMDLGPFPRFLPGDRDEYQPANPPEVPWWPEPFDPSYPN
jgi:hypothetical protein